MSKFDEAGFYEKFLQCLDEQVIATGNLVRVVTLNEIAEFYPNRYPCKFYERRVLHSLRRVTYSFYILPCGIDICQAKGASLALVNSSMRYEMHNRSRSDSHAVSLFTWHPRSSTERSDDPLDPYNTSDLAIDDFKGVFIPVTKYKDAIDRAIRNVLADTL